MPAFGLPKGLLQNGRVGNRLTPAATSLVRLLLVADDQSSVQALRGLTTGRPAPLSTPNLGGEGTTKPQFHLAFTLVHCDPGTVSARWDAADKVTDYVAPLARSLFPLVDISVSTDTLHYACVSSVPTYNRY